MKKLFSLILLCSTLSLASCVDAPSESVELANSETNTTDNASNENTSNEGNNNTSSESGNTGGSGGNTNPETPEEVNYDGNLALYLKDSQTLAESVELDCGSSRISNNNSDSLQGATSAAFPSSVEIDANFPSNLNGKVKIEWSIPNDDSTYFSLNTTTGNTVKVTATNPSRLSTLTAKMIRNDNNTVLKQATCELRSVMINTYWYKDQSLTNNKLCSIDLGSYASGYSARFYATSYGTDRDVVFPSKLKAKVDNQDVIKNVCRIVGLATTGGSGGLDTNSQISCRYLYIPNTVYMISGSAFAYVNPQNAPIFQSGGVGYTYLHTNAIGWVTDTAVYTGFVDKIDLSNGSFPYEGYAIVSGETSIGVSFINLTSVSNIKDKNCPGNSTNNKASPILLKKKA